MDPLVKISLPAEAARGALNAIHERLVLGRRVRVLAALMAEAIEGPGRVLDIGSGDGRIAAGIARARPDLAVEAVDVMVRPQTALPVRPYDGVRLPFPDASFEHATLVDVLHHAEDPGALLAEARRVATRSIVVKDHLREGFLAGLTLTLMDWAGNGGRGVGSTYRYLDREEWDRLLAGIGLGVGAWRDRLGLYGFGLGALFERRLHFIARLEPNSTKSMGFL